MNEYEEQADKFLKETNTSFKAEFLKYGKHFEDEKDERDIYIITLKRGEREYIFNFGQSLAESGFNVININTKKEIKYRFQSEALVFANGDESKYKQFVKNKITLGCIKIDNLMRKPTAYDILACLTKYNPETFKDFCDNFGYDYDSRRAERTYNSVIEEYQNVRMLWSDEEIENLQEIN